MNACLANPSSAFIAELPAHLRAPVESLCLEELEESLLDLISLADFQTWLQQQKTLD